MIIKLTKNNKIQPIVDFLKGKERIYFGPIFRGYYLEYIFDPSKGKIISNYFVQQIRRYIDDRDKFDIFKYEGYTIKIQATYSYELDYHWWYWCDVYLLKYKQSIQQLCNSNFEMFENIYNNLDKY